jgi:hypothetical protein
LSDPPTRHIVLYQRLALRLSIAFCGCDEFDERNGYLMRTTRC